MGPLTPDATREADYRAGTLFVFPRKHSLLFRHQGAITLYRMSGLVWLSFFKMRQVLPPSVVTVIVSWA